MFRSARITLTLWYVIIAAVITAFFSALIYDGITSEFERGLQRERIRIEQGLMPVPGQSVNRVYIRQPDPALMAEVRQRILMRILLVDSVIVAIAALSGFFLAGRTLKPIKEMVDKQNRFISDASHELRTPLTAARTSLEVGIRDKQLSLPEAKELLDSTLDDVKNIQHLSDNLLTLAQFQNGNKQSKFEEVSIQQIIEKARKQVSSLAKQKNIEITIEKSDHLIEGNTGALKELFVILLDNAIKYSQPDKQITITAKRLDGHVEIKVIDQGEGIAAKDLPFIFDRFYRTEDSRTRSETTGYGLGLSIAQKIIEEHAGTMQVKSKVEEGTTFIVKLPVAPEKIDKE